MVDSLHCEGFSAVALDDEKLPETSESSEPQLTYSFHWRVPFIHSFSSSGSLRTHAGRVKGIDSDWESQKRAIFASRPYLGPAEEVALALAPVMHNYDDSGADEASSLLAQPPINSPMVSSARTSPTCRTAEDSQEACEYKWLWRLLFLHALMAARWCALPAAAFASSGSVVVALRLTGEFMTFSMSVLFADATAAAYASSPGPVPRAPRPARAAVVAACSCVFAVVVATLSRAPGCLPPGVLPDGRTICAWELAVTLLLLYAVVAIVVGKLCFGTQHFLVALYCSWAAFESLLSLGLSGGLQFASIWLLSNGSDGAISSEWLWFWWLLLFQHVLSWTAVAVQIVVFVLLARNRRRRRSAQPSLMYSGVTRNSDLGDEESVISAVDKYKDMNGDSIDRLIAAVRVSFGKAWHWKCAVVLASLYTLLLLVGSLGFLVTQLITSGKLYNDPTLISGSCTGCYCTPRFPSEGVNVTSEISYGPDPRHVLDVYLPPRNASAPTSQALPAIVLMHGGGFLKGSKKDGSVVEEATRFATQGFVAVSIDYRLAAKHPLPSVEAVTQATQDARRAIDFVAQAEFAAQFATVDQTRIAMWGVSAGAIAAASMSFVHPIAVNSSSAGADTGGTYASPKLRAAVGVSGCIWPFVVTPSSRRRESPAPWLDVHGDQDDRVFPFLARVTYDYLKAHNAQPAHNHLAIVPGGGHVDVRDGRVQTWGATVKDVMRPKISTFLVDALNLQSHLCHVS